jgi:signal transduction histidine kinase
MLNTRPPLDYLLAPTLRRFGTNAASMSRAEMTRFRPITALALVVTALATWLLVRFTLCPLRRVADTAAEVATLPLDREHYAITPRVAEKDTDPRAEVGLVGDTLNQLLANASHELRTPLQRSRDTPN